MSDIDKILEDVERREATRPRGYLDRIPTEEECRSMTLAAEVRRVRAELANMRDQLVKAADKITFQRRKLVEAAIEIARISWLEYGVATSTCIESARSKYGIRLKFEDGRFVKDKSE